MLRTQRIDALKNIQKQIISFISILLVVTLGTAIFLVCGMTVKIMRGGLDSYYSQLDYRDLEVRSTRGMDQSDVNFVKEMDGVKNAEGYITLDMVASGSKSKDSVHVVSKTESIDRVEVISGQIPQASGECAISENLSKKIGAELGSEIKITNYDGDSPYLKTDTFKVTAIIRHPSKIRAEEQSTTTVVIPYSDFNTDALTVAYTGILVQIKGGYYMYSKEYEKAIDSISNDLVIAGKTRTQLQDEKLVQKFVNKIGDAMAKALAGESSDTPVDLSFGKIKINLTTPQLMIISAAISAAGGTVAETIRDLLKNVMEPGQWIVLPRSANLSYMDMTMTSGVIDKVKISFALLFIALSVLVCYATIGKIIDEQKKLVGTTKALGFTRKEIFGKYLVFGCLGTFLGAVLGFLVAYFGLLQIIIPTLNKTYLLGGLKRAYEIVPTVLSIVLATILGAVATYVACSKLLKKSAVKLLNPEVSTSWTKEKKVAEGKKPRSLYSGLIFRNIRSDFKRVLVTITSIVGSCTLLLIGFSLKFVFVSTMERQYDQIERFDATVTFVSDTKGENAERIGNIMSQFADRKVPAFESSTVLRFSGRTEVCNMVACDPDELRNVVNIYDVTKERLVRIPDNGVIVYKGLANACHLTIGDHISLLSPSGAFRDAEITGIYDNYFGARVYMSDTYARELFKTDYRINSFFLFADESRLDLLEDMVKTDESFVSFITKEDNMAKANFMSKTLNIVILMMISMAAIMSAVVLLNLVRIQINQKKRELTIMRINGFTVRETINYVLKENIFTTLIGIVFGLIVGEFITKYILAMCNSIQMQLLQDVNWLACGLSALITLFFSFVINMIALSKVRRLKLNDLN